jgi:hypothetical protein
MNRHDTYTGDLHPEAPSLLTLINCPDILETQTLADIQAMFKNSGYSEENIGDITFGWGAKVGDSNLSTSSLIRTSDQKIVCIGMGSEGGYFINTAVVNADAPTPEELGNLVYYLLLHPALSAKVRRYCRNYLTITVIEPEIRGFRCTVEDILQRFSTGE